ncbi:MAG: hypothetical protein COA96_13110 [SAR86 cluster bacterium]|uniref:DNA-binding protein n=1 Tax=SAR86 cluster bacterium TaxID=2030880 RepID=A0A2A5AUC1_9GAMM|nr:MAG: hypothetical protein COA96_13110 [SAR86 cluster bacterium]
MEQNLIAQPDETLEVSTKETAVILGLAPSTLRKWRCTREQPDLRYTKRFGKVFYVKSQVLIFKEAMTEPDRKEVYL